MVINMYVTQPGRPYGTVVRRSHYNDPIDLTPGRAAGNSRIWGDAPWEVQQQVIDSLVVKSSQYGLDAHDTAYILAIARIESGFNPDAAAGTTTASGLGQFIDRTGAAYGLDNSNRFDLDSNADALVRHYIENKNLAAQRGLGEEYVYKFHHDGPTRDYGGLQLSIDRVMPWVKLIEDALKGLSGVPIDPALEGPIL